MIHKMLLSDWISMSLHKDTLQQIIGAIEDGEPIQPRQNSNRGYLAKILREEVFKQFGGYERPILETVLNAIDARPDDHEGDYDIKMSF